MNIKDVLEMLMNVYDMVKIQLLGLLVFCVILAIFLSINIIREESQQNTPLQRIRRTTQAPYGQEEDDEIVEEEDEDVP